MNKIDFKNLGDNSEHTSDLRLVRLDRSQTAVVFFTSSGEKIDVHYCSEPEIQNYVRCNDEHCVLCAIQNEKVPRYLLPIYLLVSRVIAILAVSPSMRPKALLPQVLMILKSASEPTAALISRQSNTQFSVEPQPLPAEVDAGEVLIAEFMGQYRADKIKPSEVYLQISNEELRRLPEIAQMVKFLDLDL